MSHAKTGALERREVLGALAAVAGLAAFPGTALAVDAGVMGMTMPLMGAQPLDANVTTEFYDQLAGELGEDKLLALAEVVKNNPGDGLNAAITKAGLDDVTNRVIELFYTGIVKRESGQVVLHYLDTLQWIALDTFTKPPSRCGQDFGYWNHAPDL